MIVVYFGEGDPHSLLAETTQDEAFIVAAHEQGLNLIRMIEEAAELGLISA